MPVTVTVRYYHLLRALAGCHAEKLSLDDTPQTVGSVVTAAIARHPTMAPMRPTMLLARNAAFAAASEPATDGDIIDIMPPVSGG